MSTTRRRFLLAGAAAGGLLIGYGLFKPRDLLGPAEVLPAGDDEVALNAWLRIAADGTVTVAVPRAEMGQGVYTSLPMLVAEELEVPFDAVAVEQAPIASVYGNVVVMEATAPFDPHSDALLARAARWTFARLGRTLAVQVTGGSTSVRDAWLPMRAAGAAARDMLLRAAAARLDVHVNDLVARGGEVRHEATGRVLGYGALAAEAAKLAPPGDIPFKDPADYRLLGRPVPRTDVPAKTDGSATFGADVRPEGLLHAALRIAPVFGGTLADFDRETLETANGVEAVVALDDALAVVARTHWHAEQALQKADLRFDDGEHANASSAGMFEDYARALDGDDLFTYERVGDPAGAFENAEPFGAEYRVPLLAHACMEPMNCTVRVDADGAEIWLGNQAPDLMRLIAADALGIDKSKVVLHTPFLGGGFGRRAEPDVLRYAIAIAKTLPGRPVQLLYSRETDIQHDTYRPCALSRFRAALDAEGRLLAWHHRIASPSVSQATIGRAFPSLPTGGPDRTNTEGAAFLPYAMPHRRVEHAAVPLPVPVGFWRSVGHSFNAFFTECFLDECAEAAGADPLEFRLRHLADRPREARVLGVLREVADWDAGPPDGQGRGLALHESFASIVAQVADVSVEDGQVRVHRVVCVADCGRVVNPDTVIAQMESGIVFGLTAALFGDVRVENGRVMQWNFPDYRMLTLKDTPRIEVHVLDADGEPGGVGEPGTPPIAPAVANAVSRLTGARVRSLPVRVGNAS